MDATAGDPSGEPVRGMQCGAEGHLCPYEEGKNGVQDAQGTHYQSLQVLNANIKCEYRVSTQAKNWNFVLIVCNWCKYNIAYIL